MTATATIFMSQVEHDFYTIVALAEVMGGPRLLGNQFLFEHQVLDDDSFCPITGDEECDTRDKWFANEHEDLVALFGRDFADTIFCKVEFQYELTEYEAEERNAFQRDRFRGKVWA